MINIVKHYISKVNPNRKTMKTRLTNSTQILATVKCKRTIRPGKFGGFLFIREVGYEDLPNFHW